MHLLNRTGIGRIKRNTNAGFAIIIPAFNEDGELLRLVFVRPFCADCTLNGTLNKPDYWVDIE
jgi:hypothetical protein